MMRIQENNRFEFSAGLGLYVGSGEEFQVVANKLDTFSVTAIHCHDQRFQFRFIAFVYFVQEIFHQCQFAAAGRTVKNNMGNLVERDESVELL
jgi:hypothetical protein